jgi:hypothetical protein
MIGTARYRRKTNREYKQKRIQHFGMKYRKEKDKRWVLGTKPLKGATRV